ncbi:MAG TPA: LLM class flavin-dependent oxidoreductase [Gryllotalpicola sp.]
MRFGIVILPQYPWPAAGRMWKKAEELGFDHAWTYDHLAWRDLADQPWGATIPTLTAAALATTTIRLGTFVTSPNFRHPVPFAKDLATLDEIAGGRFILGVGSGAARSFDSAVLGEPELTARQRHERYVEFVELLDRLLRFEQGEQADAGGISYAGEWYRAVGARMVGAPAQSPRMPFAVAASGPKGLELAARFGAAWTTLGSWGVDAAAWWRGVAELVERFEEAAVRAGRDPQTIERHLSLDATDGSRFALASVGAFEDMVGRAAELGFTDVVMHWPRAEGDYAGDEKVLDEASARFDRYR